VAVRDGEYCAIEHEGGEKREARTRKEWRCRLIEQAPGPGATKRGRQPPQHLRTGRQHGAERRITHSQSRRLTCDDSDGVLRGNMFALALRTMRARAFAATAPLLSVPGHKPHQARPPMRFRSASLQHRSPDCWTLSNVFLAGTRPWSSSSCPESPTALARALDLALLMALCTPSLAQAATIHACWAVPGWS
jgi:hypothetical protein